VLDITRALASLLEAGLPLAQALDSAGAIASEGVAGTLSDIRARVERGESLAAALADHRSLFASSYVGVVRAGERSGDLVTAFGRLTEQLEREEELRSSLLSASIYPMILAVLGGLAIVTLLVFVLPRFAELLEGAGAALPRSTALMLGLGDLFRSSWPFLLGALVGAVVIGHRFAQTDGGRRLGGRVMSAMPVVRGLRRDLLAARFSRLLSVLLGGGAPLLAALDDLHDSLTDPLARAESARIRQRVREGASLQAAVHEGGFFPPLLIRLIAVGESSGKLQPFLLKAAGIFESRADRTLRRLASLAEPVMILVFGTIVALVALSLLQAIYGVNAGAFR
jgi:general secretion pathway protein F